jgi:predicted MPP superfamily phosphohydrolase
MFLLHSDIFIWDLAILLIMTFTLCGGIGCAIWTRRHCERSLQKLFIGTLSVLGFLGCITITYAAFIEPQILVVTRVQVTHPKAPPMKIAVISDAHIGPYKGEAFLQKVVKKMNGLLPDLVLMSGDFVFTRSADPNELAPFSDINAPLGAFAVLGNHDVGEYQSPTGKRYSGENRGENIAQKLEDFGVNVLRNKHVILSLPNANVAIAGIDDLWTGYHDLPQSFRGIPDDTFTILLSHNPSVIDVKESTAADLIVSGHTHGGQLRIPNIGPFTELHTSLGKQFDQGVFPLEDGRTLAITRGVGESSARTRLFAWPEIMVIELRSP